MRASRLLCLLATVIALAACGSDDTPAAETPTTPPAAATQESMRQWTDRADPRVSRLTEYLTDFGEALDAQDVSALAEACGALRVFEDDAALESAPDPEVARLIASALDHLQQMVDGCFADPLDRGVVEAERAAFEADLLAAFDRAKTFQ